jgi:two-component system response regulator PilR (NtrC family)
MIKRAIAMRDWNFVFEELHLEDVDSEKGSEQNTAESASVLTWEDNKLKILFEENDYSLKKITKAFVSEAEQRMIIKTLEENRWNRTKAAKALSTSYRTLLARIEEFGLKE